MEAIFTKNVFIDAKSSRFKQKLSTNSQTWSDRELALQNLATKLRKFWNLYHDDSIKF